MGEPIAGASVRIFHQLDEQGRPVPGTVWQRTDTTDPTGHFELSDYANPGQVNRVGLEIKAPGYSDAYTTYWDVIDVDEEFVVLLAPTTVDTNTR